MTLYTDYKFYTETYLGNMPENSFDILVIRASREVQNRIMNRDITGYEEEVQMATCSVADILYTIEQLKESKTSLINSYNSNGSITSKKVGDLQLNYNSASFDSLDEEISNQENKIQNEIEKYLMFTGLLYRGIKDGRFIR